MRRLYKLLVAALFAMPLIAEDTNIFRPCQSCHAFVDPANEEASRRVGPNLYGRAGEPAGGVEAFNYSAAFGVLNTDGQILDVEFLDKFLRDPMATVPGTSMRFAGVKDDNTRAQLVDLLFSAQTVTGDPALPAEILAIEGDPEYGQYLASTCTTCHQLDGDDNGIPSIIGWPTDQFVTVMHAYKNKDRDSDVMQQYAGALSNDEIAALAAYFATIE